MIEVAADEVVVVLEDAATRPGVVRETGLSSMRGCKVWVDLRRRGIRSDT
jgi:hypothetical protein